MDAASGIGGSEMTIKTLDSAAERYKRERDDLLLTLIIIRDGHFDDLDPDDGLHTNSARKLARDAVDKIGTEARRITDSKMP
jgi:hypothetical protein